MLSVIVIPLPRGVPWSGFCLLLTMSGVVDRKGTFIRKCQQSNFFGHFGFDNKASVNQVSLLFNKGLVSGHILLKKKHSLKGFGHKLKNKTKARKKKKAIVPCIFTKRHFLASMFYGDGCQKYARPVSMF